MKYIITGGRGQLATALKKKLGEEALVFSRDQLDITHWKKVREVIEVEKPDVIINCAAFTDVDGCELDSQEAFRINAIAPFNLARIAADVGTKLVHISTDYVFSGDKSSPYVESDCPGPISVYGLSKYAGERGVINVEPSFLVVRVSGLYGPSSRTGIYNFVLFVLKTAEEKGEVPLIVDQVLSPSYTIDVAEGILKLINEGVEGIVHLANQGAVSWAELGREILKIAGKTARIKPVRWADLKRPAKRPRFSAIESERILWKLPTWSDALRRYIKELST